MTQDEGSLRSQASGEVVESRATSQLLRGMARRASAYRRSWRGSNASLSTARREYKDLLRVMANAAGITRMTVKPQQITELILRRRADVLKLQEERDALREQLDRAVFVWPQDAMFRVRECIADPSRMGVREEETVAGWGARAVIKLMESWRADPSRDSATSEASQEAIEWAEAAVPLANEANALIEGYDTPPAAGEADTTPRSTAAMVYDFHKRFGVKINADATLQLLTLRAKLLAEEAREAGEALLEWNMPQIAKELADVVYVAYGAACSLGIDLDEAVRLVHESNMSKLDVDGLPICDDDGKILKGPNYRPPVMKSALPSVQFWSDGKLHRADEVLPNTEQEATNG